MEAARSERAAEPECRVKRNVFRYCEGELYDYHISKARLADLRGDILNGTGTLDSAGPVSHGPGDAAQARALRLVSDREIVRLERITRSIEVVYLRLPEDYRQLIELKYWGGHPMGWRPDGGRHTRLDLSNSGVARELHISQSTFDRRRREIIETLSYCLGA